MTDADSLGLQIICAGKLALCLCDDNLVGNRLIAGGGHRNLVGAGAKRNGGGAIDRHPIDAYLTGRCHRCPQNAGNHWNIDRQSGVLRCRDGDAALNLFMIIRGHGKLVITGGKLGIEGAGLADKLPVQIPVDRC